MGILENKFLKVLYSITDINAVNSTDIRSPHVLSSPLQNNLPLIAGYIF